MPFPDKANLSNHILMLKTKTNELFLRESILSNPFIISLIFVVASFFWTLIPPFQSPDENAHITRAYLLIRGNIILDAPEGKSSGGMIDSGLATYMTTYRALNFDYYRKLTANETHSAKLINWTGIKEFSEAPGTNYYFPIIYFPQAIGLAIGETLGLTVDTSYRLARFMTLAAIIAILFSAFKIYPTNPLTIALLLIPMTVFQFASASLDGISTALAILAISIFFRIASEKENSSPWLFYALTFSVVILSTSRTHLLPLLTFILAACFYTKNKKYFYTLLGSLCFVIAWLIISIKTTVFTSIALGGSTSSIAFFYIKHPLAFFDVLTTTLSNGTTIKFYIKSFFGILGWLDTEFGPKAYYFLLICTSFIGLLSVSFNNFRTEWIPRSIIFFASVLSIFLIFFALLITWTPHPAIDIKGVQGRYFLVPMIMIAYAISGGEKIDKGAYRKTTIFLVILIAAFTFIMTPWLLIDRYYLYKI